MKFSDGQIEARLSALVEKLLWAPKGGEDWSQGSRESAVSGSKALLAREALLAWPGPGRRNSQS